jgi:Na+:H+ antiporter, NhaA family
MSLFIVMLGLTDPALLAAAKLGILVASLLAGLAGFLVLRQSRPSALSAEALPRTEEVFRP